MGADNGCTLSSRARGETINPHDPLQGLLGGRLPLEPHLGHDCRLSSHCSQRPLGCLAANCTHFALQCGQLIPQNNTIILPAASSVEIAL
jgi:hypothetical protein